MKTILRLLGGLILVTILLIAGLLGYATATESGLQTVLSLARQAAPGDLQFHRASGRLLGPLDLQDLSYRQDNGLEVRLQSASLNWQPGALLSRRLKIDQLRADGIDIYLPEPSPASKEEPATSVTLPEIRLPLAIDIQDIDLRNIRIYPYKVEKPIEIKQLQLAASARDDTFRVVHFKFKSPEAQAELSGTVKPVGDYPLDIKLDWQYEHPEFGAFSGGGTASGDLARLQVAHNVDGAAQLKIESELIDLIRQPAWDARIEITVNDPGKFSPQLNKPIKANLVSKGNLADFSATGRIDSKLTQTGPFTFNFNARGDSAQIRLQEAVLKLRDRPTRISLHGDADIQALTLDVQGEWFSLAWPLVGDENEFSSPAGQFSFKGSAKDFTARIEAGIEGQQLEPLDFKLEASGSNEVLALSSLSLRAPDSDLQLNLQGRFNLAEQRFQATGDWQSLTWPMQGEAQIKSPAGRFEAAGLLTDYSFELTTDVEGKDLPKGSWKLSGQGSDQALDQFSLDGKTLDGKVRASGNAAWQPEVTWQVELSGDDLNPAAHWPELPGSLTTRLKTQGGLTADGPALSADITQLSGKFRGQNLRGQGRIQMQGKTLDIQALNLSSGQTRLSANGRLGDRWDLSWRLEAPDLAQLVPKLAGTIKAGGKLSGTPEKPRASLDLDVSKLASGENRINRLKGSAQIDISGARRSVLDFQGSDLVLGGQQWSDFTLAGSGTPAKHDLNIKLKGKPAHLEAALDGGLQDQQWIGRLTQLAARKTKFGDWTLQQPTAIRADKSQASAQSICLSSEPTLLCLSGQWNATRGSTGELTLTALEAMRFKRFLPDGMQLDTALSGRVNGGIDAKGVARAQADFSLRPGKLMLDNMGEAVTIELEAGTLKADLQGEKASARIALDLGKLGNINTETGISSLHGAQRLSGSLKTGLDDLTLLSTFVPQLQAVEGRLHADLQLGGTVKAPAITGELRLSDFAAEVPEVAIHIKDTQLSARSSGRGPLLIEGSAHSGEGKLELSGQLDPTSQTLQLNIRGSEFQVANSRAIRALISPDLNINMDGDGMKIEGKLTIPQAYINAKGSGGEGGTVSVSKDIVVIDENGEPAKKQKGGNLNLHVRVILGDDIKVDAADFHGALKGNLLIEQTPELAPRGTGTIEVVNGDFLVYGQQLNMQRGRILFSGGPIDNPRLDMDVARRVEAYNVLAGAKIRGTAQAPLMQLYSEPSMPDASILSYILIGQPPGAKGGSYTLGKYITPDLYVSYGIALFNAISSFNMRYKLTEKLSLKAASGAASSADLIYTIER